MEDNSAAVENASHARGTQARAITFISLDERGIVLFRTTSEAPEDAAARPLHGFRDKNTVGSG